MARSTRGRLQLEQASQGDVWMIRVALACVVFLGHRFLHDAGVLTGAW